MDLTPAPAPLTTTQPCVLHPKHTPPSHIQHKHHVWPLGHGGPDTPENLIVVCPTGHYNIHRLIEEYITTRGEAPYSLTRQYSLQERRVARLGYDRLTRRAM